MTTSLDIETEIIRLFYSERWNITSIANNLAVHRSVVKRVLERRITNTHYSSPRKRMIDEFLPFIGETLEDHPSLTASTLFNMVKMRGYAGKISQFRDIIAEIRPRRREAFLRLIKIKGEEAQVDWGHFGTIEHEGFKRPLVAFVMTLSFSRAIFVHFFMSLRMGPFCVGHQLAFEWFGGVPRECLYDNLKSVVISRHGKIITYNEDFLAFAQIYRFGLKVAGVARGNEKGRTERAIRYIRDNFFAACKFKDIHDLNQQAQVWMNTISLDRKWQQDSRKTVREAFQEEQAVLLPLNRDIPVYEEQISASIGKTPYIRFDNNDYSVPPRYVHSIVTILASDTRVRIISKEEEIANHQRSYGKGMRVEKEEHLRELLENKREASLRGDGSILLNVAPSADKFLGKLNKREYSPKYAKSSLERMLRTYGAELLEAALKNCCDAEQYSVNSLEIVLEELYKATRSGAGVALPSNLPEHANRHDATPVKQHDISAYKKVGGSDDE
jgi:transposase